MNDRFLSVDICWQSLKLLVASCCLNSINSCYFQFPLKQDLYLTDQANDVHMGCSCITSCELAGHQSCNVLFVGSHNLTISVQAKDLIDGLGYLKEVGRTEEETLHFIEQICTCWCFDKFVEL